MSDPAQTFSIRALSADKAFAAIDALSDVLIDCVAGGASVSFMANLDRTIAQNFWRGVAEGVARNDRILLVADDAKGIIGTVQVVVAPQDNQPHRADVAKMLVHRRARRKGLGATLMAAAEEAARDAGRTVLVLDTATGEAAERLYTRCGWTRVGVVPDYALFPDGRMCATTFFFKRIGQTQA